MRDWMKGMYRDKGRLGSGAGGGGELPPPNFFFLILIYIGTNFSNFVL